MMTDECSGKAVLFVFGDCMKGSTHPTQKQSAWEPGMDLQRRRSYSLRIGTVFFFLMMIMTVDYVRPIDLSSLGFRVPAVMQFFLVLSRMSISIPILLRAGTEL